MRVLVFPKNEQDVIDCLHIVSVRDPSIDSTSYCCLLVPFNSPSLGLVPTHTVQLSDSRVEEHSAFQNVSEAAH